MSGQNFLIAGLIARSHGLHDDGAGRPRPARALRATVASALAAYLRAARPGRRRARQPTCSPPWPSLRRQACPSGCGSWQSRPSIGTHVAREDLTRFARSSAANFLVETPAPPQSVRRIPAPVRPVYRLFHQALNDALLHARADITPRADDERALTRAFTALGRAEPVAERPGLPAALPARSRTRCRAGR